MGTWVQSCLAKYLNHFIKAFLIEVGLCEVALADHLVLTSDRLVHLWCNQVIVWSEVAKADHLVHLTG